MIGRDERPYWTVGVDCGEQKHRFVVLDDSCNRVAERWVHNRADEIQQVFAELVCSVDSGVGLRIVTEGLRSLGGILVQVGNPLGIEFWQVNPKALNHFRDLEGQPRKDDDRDAELLAKMRINRMEGCRLAVASKSEERVLCRLTRLHSQMVKSKTAARKRLRSRLLELSPEILAKDWQGPAYNSKAIRAVLDRWPGFQGLERARVSTIARVLAANRVKAPQSVTPVMKDMARRIVLCQPEREVVALELAELIREIRSIEASLKVVDRKIEQAVRHHPIGLKLLEMPGVGPFTAGVLIGEVLPLARHVDEGKAATYAGLTPLSRRSGNGGGPSKLARGVNKHAIHALYLAAVAARGASAIDDAYYRKQLARHAGHPKPHVKANLALARQRFKVMHKLMVSDARYDKEILIASHLERLRRLDQARHQSNAA